MASRGKESKLDESVWEWTVGRMGGERVRAARPAQLNPCAQNALPGHIMCDLKLALCRARVHFFHRLSIFERATGSQVHNNCSMPEKHQGGKFFSNLMVPYFFREEEKLAASLAHMVPHPLSPLLPPTVPPLS
jgi:hypothetical protein